MARPTDFEQRRRKLDFWRELAVTRSLKAAVSRSSIDPRQVIDLLEDPVTRPVVLALLDQQAA